MVDKKVNTGLKCVICAEKKHDAEAEYIYNGCSVCKEHKDEMLDVDMADTTVGFKFNAEGGNAKR